MSFAPGLGCVLAAGREWVCAALHPPAVAIVSRRRLVRDERCEPDSQGDVERKGRHPAASLAF